LVYYLNFKRFAVPFSIVMFPVDCLGNKSYIYRRAIFERPPRRFSLAVTKLDKRIQEFQEDRWRDMGAVLLTFAVYTQPDGVLVVDR
jgi:hypothetical protein